MKTTILTLTLALLIAFAGYTEEQAPAAQQEGTTEVTETKDKKEKKVKKAKKEKKEKKVKKEKKEKKAKKEKKGKKVKGKPESETIDTNTVPTPGEEIEEPAEESSIDS